MVPIILDSARKRGHADEDMLHAWRNAFRVFEQADEMTMFVGGDRTGRIPEVGVVTADDGTAFIAHCMDARDKYLR